MILPYFLFAGQLLSLCALFYAPFVFSAADWAATMFMYFIGGCLGGSVTFHRLLSHRSWKAPTWWTYIGSLCGMLFLIGSPLAWANAHIAHHKFVDTEKDPHSPTHKGFFRVQWLSMFDTPQTMRYGLRNINPFQTFLHKHYVGLHLTYSFTVFWLAGLHGLAVWYLVPSALIWNMASLVNTLNHMVVKGNYRLEVSSTSEPKQGKAHNNLLTGFLVWGEGWHHNHHVAPHSANFGKAWWELDVSYLVIKLLEVKQ